MNMNAAQGRGGNNLSGITIKRPSNKPILPGGKLMRLRCRFRTLHDSCLLDGHINEGNADVTFITMDGQKVLAHKIILAAASTFFVAMFEDQRSEEMTTVIVPDVKGETLRLILKLAYTDSISVTMKQIKEVGSFISLFGMGWNQFNFDAFDEIPPVASSSTNRIEYPETSKLTASAMIGRNSLSSIRSVIKTNNPPPQGHFLDNNKKVVAPQQTKPLNNGRGPENSDNYAFEMQGYGNSGGINNTARQSNIGPEKQLKQLTVTQKRPLVTYGKPSVSHNTQRHGAEDFRQGSNPRIETGNDGYDNDDTHFAGVNSDIEDARKMITEWMAKVGKEHDEVPPMRVAKLGKEENIPKQSNPSMRANTSTRVPTPPLAANQAVNTCTVCNFEFNNHNAWKWHEQRHIGMGIFKCGHCDQLFGTAKKVYQHEDTEHRVKNVPSEYAELSADTDMETEDKLASGRKRKQIPREEYTAPIIESPTVPRLTLIKSKVGTQYRRVVTPNATIKMAAKLKSASVSTQNQKSQAIKLSDVPIGHIGQGHSPGSELIDSNKMKQLHWLYNCTKCDSCSDTVSKAKTHYNSCYPDEETPFEKTVVKYRQGFYGKFRCPLCPRRYTSIAGFMIHCGHMHTEYGKKFTQTNDGLKCGQCKLSFSLPAQFDEHLKDNECPESLNPPNISKEGNFGAESSKKKGATPSKMPRLSSNPPRKHYESALDDMIAKRRSQSLTGRSPRSARLANRILNESLGKEGGKDEKVFKKIDCPICGTDNIVNLNLHLSSEHSELGMEIQRLSEDLLRCLKCRLTFAICDLFSHSNSCTGSKEFEFVSQRLQKAKSQHKPSVPYVAPKDYVIPPGVGCSPMDKMDFTNLNCLETYQANLKCNVCGRVARKLGVISDCLKAHGIWRCALCFNTYSNKPDYSTHLKEFHGQGNVQARLNCPICDKRLANTGQVASHMHLIHWVPLLNGRKKEDAVVTHETVPIEATEGDSKIPAVLEESIGETTEEDTSLVSVGETTENVTGSSTTTIEKPDKLMSCAPPEVPSTAAIVSEESLKEEKAALVSEEKSSATQSLQKEVNPIETVTDTVKADDLKPPPSTADAVDAEKEDIPGGETETAAVDIKDDSQEDDSQKDDSQKDDSQKNDSQKDDSQKDHVEPENVESAQA